MWDADRIRAKNAFVRRNKKAIEFAIDKNEPSTKRLLLKARNELNYAPTTNDVDILRGLRNSFSKMYYNM